MSLARGYSFDFEVFWDKRGVCMCVRHGGEVGGGGRGCRGSEGVGMDLYASPERRMSFIFLLLS